MLFFGDGASAPAEKVAIVNAPTSSADQRQYPIRISTTTGLSARTPASLDNSSLSPESSARASFGSLGSAASRMPILQPPGIAPSAPPSQPATPVLPSASKPDNLNGRPFASSSAASGRPSFMPFGALHCDLPLIAITDVSLRPASLAQITSRRRFGSLGKRMLPGILVPSGPSTSPNVMLRESYLSASLR